MPWAFSLGVKSASGPRLSVTMTVTMTVVVGGRARGWSWEKPQPGLQGLISCLFRYSQAFLSVFRTDSIWSESLALFEAWL